MYKNKSIAEVKDLKSNKKLSTFSNLFSWFHGTISRIEAENILRMHREGGFLVRMSESNRFDFSLSLKYVFEVSSRNDWLDNVDYETFLWITCFRYFRRSARGFMHMKIVTNPDGRYILGQFSQPFSSIPHMIHHYTIHKLPIKGAEHMSLVYPVGIELLWQAEREDPPPSPY